LLSTIVINRIDAVTASGVWDEPCHRPRSSSRSKRRHATTTPDSRSSPRRLGNASPRQRVVYYEAFCCRQSMCAGTTLLITGLLKTTDSTHHRTPVRCPAVGQHRRRSHTGHRQSRHLVRTHGTSHKYTYICCSLVWPPSGIVQAIMLSPSGFFFLLSFFFFSRLFSAVADWMSTILPHMMWP